MPKTKKVADVPDLTIERFKRKFDWKKVHAPKTWAPRDIGEELVGYYGGRTMRNGAFGQYEVVIVHVPYRGSWMVSGTEIIQLLDSAAIQKGHPIRVVFKGMLALGGERTKKRFDLLIAEGDALSEEELPELR